MIYRARAGRWQGNSGGGSNGARHLCRRNVRMKSALQKTPTLPDCFALLLRTAARTDGWGEDAPATRSRRRLRYRGGGSARIRLRARAQFSFLHFSLAPGFSRVLLERKTGQPF